jgi:CRISPR type III-B/RAMP module RAMP protein Cmr6
MDNFYIKIHKGEEKPFYKRDILSEKQASDKAKNKQKIKKHEAIFKSQFFRLYDIFDAKLEYKEFDANFLQNICFRQLIHSQALCEYLPLKVDIALKDGALKRRISELKEQYRGVFDSEIDWLLAIGLGQASVFETSITLHHIYGIPYIPASAVKGLLRSWIITEYFSNEGKNLKNAECEALQDLSFCKIFGAPKECEGTKQKTKTGGMYDSEYMGDIVFFDAFPTKPPTVSVDIMNPHYQPYYSDETNKIPPADWQSPVPIFFLTVKDTSFQFLFGIRKGRENFDVEIGEHKSNVIAVLKELLTEALTKHGIGAKTAVGYGRMKGTN